MTSWEKAFETEKNRKAATYTGIVLGVLLLMFFLISWKNVPPPAPVVEDLLELNLGNNEDGWGEEQPLIKGEMSPSQEATVVPQQQAAAEPEQEEAVTPDDNAEEIAAPVVKSVKPTPKPIKPTTPAPVPTPAPKPQKPKITYNGPGNGNGNNATEDNGYRSQGNTPGARGDAGDPSGNKDSYGNTPGGKIGGPRVTSGNRKVIRYYSFTSDLKKATIYAQIKVSAAGSGSFIKIVKPSTSFDQGYANAIAGYLRNMQFDKAGDESIVTVQFNFTVN
ncbi:MAG: hypothetical protein EOO06_10165 [Chitinophagaceae bacterium]|nr:MAG: hypothetical protein EOO06_10165 [Chitinophagaceae bacterium]